jgi:hypothetical protein
MSKSDDASPAHSRRREFLTGVGGGLIALTVTSAYGKISPKEARSRGQLLRKLSSAEGKTLDALGDALLPGAAEAGITHYVDDQLASDAPLLILKYMDYPGSSLGFYKQGLASLERVCRARRSRSFHELKPAEKADLIREFSQKSPDVWSGPPGPLFYFVTRNDAIDVYYGTQEGFGRLNIPYMAHIPPEKNW